MQFILVTAYFSPIAFLALVKAKLGSDVRHEFSPRVANLSLGPGSAIRFSDRGVGQTPLTYLHRQYRQSQTQFLPVAISQQRVQSDHRAQIVGCGCGHQLATVDLLKCVQI